MNITLIRSSVTLAFLIAVGSASAASPLLSPKAKAFAQTLKTVPSAPDEVNLTKDRPVGNAKLWELERSFRTVSTANSGVDVAHGPRPLLSPKDPRYASRLRELRNQTGGSRD